MPAGSGFAAGLHGHGHEGADEGRGKKLADDGFSDGERARDRMHWGDRTADGGKRGKTEIGKLRRELVHIRWHGNEVEGAREELLNQLKGGSPSQAKKKIGAYAALDAAPGYRAYTEHYEQHNADIEKQRAGDESASQLMKKRRRMEATGHQNRRTNEDDGDHESLGKVALLYAQCAENHQPDHNGLEEKAAAQPRLAKRCYYEDEND